MRRRYKLGTKRFWLEVVNLDEGVVDPQLAKPVNAGTMLAALVSSDLITLYVTPTFPIVYMRTKLFQGLSRYTYFMDYRPWLGLASYFEEVKDDDDEEPDWVRFGF